MNSLLDSDSNLCHGECVRSSHSTDENNECAQSCLDAIMEVVWKDDDYNEVCGGANSYKTTDGKLVFLTQAESYHHRGPAFAHYSQLEFECIVQLQEKVQLQNKAELSNKSLKIVVVFAGNVRFSNVKKMVKLTDTCVSARHVVNISANMSATQPKTVLAKVLTMLSQHVAYGYVGNMSAL